MLRHILLVVLSLLFVAVAATPAGAHITRPGQSTFGAQALVPPNSDPFTVGPRTPAVVDGPCTDRSAALQYADEKGHDHLKIENHAVACQMQQQAFLDLKKELDSDPLGNDDEVLGEMDVEGDVAAVLITYPRAGVLFFDVSNPAAPKFLRRYNGPACEGTAIDVDCGAFVDLSRDGKTAFLSVQQISVIPGLNPGAIAEPARPGVQVINVATGMLTEEQPVVSVGGVHTSRDHVVPDGPKSAEKPRRPGQYLFSVANGEGIQVSRVVSGPLGPALDDVGLISIDDTHDMFIQDDPIDGRTYMYVAAGFDTGFLVYDVTDPQAAVGDGKQLLAQWDLTPQCRNDWYSHTIDVATRNGRRYVTMPTEGFNNGAQSEDDQRGGCGKTSGNGDKASALWIVDATDFKALGQGTFADATDGRGTPAARAVKIKAASEQALTATWTNAAARPAQNINFTGHNQQIVGDRIYLSGYHSGVTVLDASAAFAGLNERPKELGFIVPSGTPTRPIYDQVNNPVIPFFSAFINFRPLIWDMVFYKGSVLAADMTGGFYAFTDPPPAPATDGAPKTAPAPPAQPAQPAAPAATPTPVACQSRAGFVSATARGTGRNGGLELDFRRRIDEPVTVDIFQQSRGRRVTGERRVRRFTGKTGPFEWNGRDGRGRKLPNGVYFARFRIESPSGQADTVRVTLGRSKGRFGPRRAFYRRDSCGTLQKFKLSRPVFGGKRSTSLGIAYRLNQGARVQVTVANRRERVIRRYSARQLDAGRTQRLTLPARGLARGDYRIKLSVTRDGRTTTSTLTANRL
ncbi:MAG: hypothetical protein AVDCRST_MAG30-2606 [uncultured Solirubrobacteraceae bacterium]|uniref:FlgD Ig-like domain-containing protein n=1 Tax=uncultured Solirubrobacteraceae bacterium TaxID=1162706 RepID=A0A6J4T4G7_9ACTN|nr:MAG: hypothetical protein AVDCRST_MAG30-2606 [uncultured Solirubrobacteraceae bacterium]